jgi:hypothetical protein
MVFPELGSDESVILQAHNIKVKSVVFEAVLTNKRLVLIDGKKGLIPPQEIQIINIKTVDGGENAIRDPILTFSILSVGGTARQMILTFPRVASGERKRERDDWLKALTAQISSVDSYPVIPDTTESDQLASQNTVIIPPSLPVSSVASSPKKKIEITRPIRNIVESAPAMPRPVETTTLPVGSFCSRCGSRVPPESVFCNRCGTPVVSSTEVPAVPQPIISTTPVAVPSVVPQAIISNPPVVVPSTVPQVQIPTPPVFGLGGDRKERTLDEVIHSIEPLIEDSKPRSSEPAPLVPRHYPAPPSVVEIPVVEPPAVAPLAESVALSPPADHVPADTSPFTSPPPTPPVVPALPPKKGKTVTIAALAIVILLVIGGIVIFSNSLGTTPATPAITPTITPIPTTVITKTATPTPSPTPVVTLEVIQTPTAQPQFAIPPNGVWVRITYSGKYSGTFGTAGSQSPVDDTGDHFYPVSTIDGPVVASIQKMDGSSNTLAIEVYKNGVLSGSDTTKSPRGTIDIQVDLKPKPTPTPVPSLTVSPTVTPVRTAALNSTVNSTGMV